MVSKSVAQKLWMKSGKKVAFFNQPADNEKLLGGIPEGVEVVDSASADILLAYIDNRNQLEEQLSKLKDQIKKNGALWIAYHKGTSSESTDINRDSISEYALNNGLKPVAMISIDDNWTGLRLKITG